MNRVDRLVVRAFVAWQTFTVRCGLACTRLACALPSDRGTQDRAIYSCALAAVVLLAVLKHVEG